MTERFHQMRHDKHKFVEIRGFSQFVAPRCERETKGSVKAKCKIFCALCTMRHFREHHFIEFRVGDMGSKSVAESPRRSSKRTSRSSVQFGKAG